MALYNYLGNILHLTPFTSVKDYGAVGDGVNDDSYAIQDALDAIGSSGGNVLFPTGTYLIENGVRFYSNQFIIFEAGAVLKQGAAIDNLMRSYCNSAITGYNGVHDVIIFGGTFDGGSFTTNNTLLGMAHSQNIIVANCIFKNAYGTWHDLEINSSYNVKVLNCDFEGSRKTGANGEMIQIDGAGSATYYPWDSINIDNTVCKYVDVSGCIFHNSSVAPGIGNHSNMAHQYVRVFDNKFIGLTSSRGAINFVSNMTDIDIYDNTFDSCTTAIASEGSTYYIYDNRFNSVTTPIYGTDSIAHNNMINGTYTA